MALEPQAIADHTRQRIVERLKRPVTQESPASSLDSVVESVVNDPDVFRLLMKLLPENKGLRLGEFSYWDDIRVRFAYGLTLNLDAPRAVVMFSQEIYPTKGLYRTAGSGFPKVFGDSHVQGVPSAEEFVYRVNNVLAKADENVISLNVG